MEQVQLCDLNVLGEVYDQLHQTKKENRANIVEYTKIIAGMQDLQYSQKMDMMESMMKLLQAMYIQRQRTINDVYALTARIQAAYLSDRESDRLITLQVKLSKLGVIQLHTFNKFSVLTTNEKKDHVIRKELALRMKKQCGNISEVIKSIEIYLTESTAIGDHVRINIQKSAVKIARSIQDFLKNLKILRDKLTRGEDMYDADVDRITGLFLEMQQAITSMAATSSPSMLEVIQSGMAQFALEDNMNQSAIASLLSSTIGQVCNYLRIQSVPSCSGEILYSDQERPPRSAELEQAEKCDLNVLNEVYGQIHQSKMETRANCVEYTQKMAKMQDLQYSQKMDWMEGMMQLIRAMHTHRLRTINGVSSMMTRIQTTYLLERASDRLIKLQVNLSKLGVAQLHTFNDFSVLTTNDKKNGEHIKQKAGANEMEKQCEEIRKVLNSIENLLADETIIDAAIKNGIQKSAIRIELAIKEFLKPLKELQVILSRSDSLFEHHMNWLGEYFKRVQEAVRSMPPIHCASTLETITTSMRDLVVEDSRLLPSIVGNSSSMIGWNGD